MKALSLAYESDSLVDIFIYHDINSITNWLFTLVSHHVEMRMCRCACRLNDESREKISQCGYKFDCLIYFQSPHKSIVVMCSRSSCVLPFVCDKLSTRNKPWNEWNRAIKSSYLLVLYLYTSNLEYESNSLKHAEVHICANMMTFIHHMYDMSEQKEQYMKNLQTFTFFLS